MNTGSTNAGGFPASAMQTTLNTTVYDAMPADLRNVIRTSFKWYGTGNSSSNGAWRGHKLWLPLEQEMGLSSYAPSTEKNNGARTYPIFTNDASRIKKRNNGAGAANIYWLASPCADYASAFCRVSSGGTAGYGAASTAYGVCFGLRGRQTE